MSNYDRIQLNWTCEGCHKRPGIFGGKRWCKKCSKNHKSELITMIPLDVFIHYIQPLLLVQDIVNLLGVSRRMKEYFNENQLWKSLHFGRKAVLSLRNKKKRMMYSTAKKTETSSWTHAERKLTGPVRLVIRNETSDIPFNIYYVSDRNNKVNSNRIIGRGVRKWGSTRKDVATPRAIRPGGEEAFRTYADHRWICIPTEEWMQMNPTSYTGFSFAVDIMNIRDIQGKSCIVRRIYQPKKLMPLKGYNRKYSSHKKEYIRLSVDRAKVSQKRLTETEQLESDQTHLQYHLEMCDKMRRHIVEGQRAITSCKMIEDILLEGKASGHVF
jgi:hypothetical protein